MNILQLRHLAFAWPGQANLWQNVTLTIAAGQNVGLMGANGSGKTTLFRCITGLLPPSCGSIVLQDKPISTEKDFQLLREQVGFCLQQAEEQLIFPQVEEDICFGPLNMGLPAADARQRARETLELLGISHLARRQTFHLSGGEQRLVALAGILAMRPRVLLLDEPLTGLDEDSARRIRDILGQLPCAKIIAAHDAAFLRGLCQSIFQLTRDGLAPVQ